MEAATDYTNGQQVMNPPESAAEGAEARNLHDDQRDGLGASPRDAEARPADASPPPSKRGKSGGKRVSMAPRSRELMEKREYTVANVEHWNAFTRRKHDLYGFIDLLCVRGEDIVGVQVTSWDNVGDRAKKITEHENYDRVKHAIRIVVQGWKKVAGRWIHREVEL